MDILNLNNAQKLYYGSIEAQKLYKGSQKLYPSSLLTTHWRVDYNGALAEISVSFDGGNNPIVPASISRLPTPLSTVTNPTLNVGALNDGIYNYTNNQRIGEGSNYARNNAYQIVFATSQNVSSIWLAPYTGPVSVYSAPSYVTLYYSLNNGTSWVLLKNWTVGTNGTHNSPYTNTLLRPNELIQFVV